MVRYWYKEKPDFTTDEKFLSDFLESKQFAEQRMTFKKLEGITKGRTDMSEPKYFSRAAKMSENKKMKASVHESVEHARELKSLKERMGSIGGWQMRQKNTTDPLAYPVWFFHSKADRKNNKRVALDHYQSRVKE